MERKGQAAMEYLMTYGWALLVIVIVIAVLLVILGRMLKGTPDCTFGEAAFVCNQPRVPFIKVSDRQLYGAFQHTLNEPINITKIGFVEGSPSVDKIGSAPDCAVALTSGVRLSPREGVTFGYIASGGSSSSGGLTVKKYDPSSDTCVEDTSLQVGSQVRGTLCIWFIRPSTAALGALDSEEHQCATVIADVQ